MLHHGDIVDLHRSKVFHKLVSIIQSSARQYAYFKHVNSVKSWNVSNAQWRLLFSMQNNIQISVFWFQFVLFFLPSLSASSLQIFSIVVFATIIAEGYINPATQGEAKCMFNNNDSACSYGVGIGVLAFLACVAFLLLDAYFPQISNANERKYIVMGDLGFSGKCPFFIFNCIFN